MGRCFSDAAVSITVTSVTDFFSFMAGVITPFPCVRIFCIYTGVSVAFIYVWHITLFAGFLALAGRAEEDNKHGLLPCLQTTPKSLAGGRSWLYRTFMTGGVDPNDPHNPEDNREHVVMAFFRDRLGGFLSKKWVKGVVLVGFASYLAAACWGVTQIKEGLEKRNTANYDSYSVKYYDMDDLYFKKYAFTISLVFSSSSADGWLDLSDPNTRRRIEFVTQTMENSSYIDAHLTQSWLRDFLDYVDRNKDYGDVRLPIDGADGQFARTLSDVYLRDPAAPSRLDVSFTDGGGGGRIRAARFLIQGHNINTSYLEQNMVAELRELCTRYSTDEMQVTVFQPYFIYIDQYLAILPQTIQTILVTAMVMIIIALFLIPSVVCSLWVSFSIVSIEVGVIGFMTLWGINLDGVALINLTMCIGFSVDFSAHICYHYIACDDKEANSSGARIRASLYALGLPILQGAISTILGVCGLAFSPSYLFVTFFKMIFLVISLGAIHGIILLPVFLSLFGPGSLAKPRSKRSVVSSAISTPSVTVFSTTKSSGKSRQRRFNDDGIQSICNCTINMAYLEDAAATNGHLPRKKVYATNSTGIVVSPSQLMILKRPKTSTTSTGSTTSTCSSASSPSLSSPSFRSKPGTVGELRKTSTSGHVTKRQHRKVCRTRSQNPTMVCCVKRDCSNNQATHGNVTATTIVAEKQPLKKAHTFPYQMLHSDTTTNSSEDDSEPVGNRHRHHHHHRHNHHHHQKHNRRKNAKH